MILDCMDMIFLNWVIGGDASHLPFTVFTLGFDEGECTM
jgi:hypothetical protein